jgi:hypothetical protein
MGELAFLPPFAYLTIFGFRLRAALIFVIGEHCMSELSLATLLSAYECVHLDVHTNC